MSDQMKPRVVKRFKNGAYPKAMFMPIEDLLDSGVVGRGLDDEVRTVLMTSNKDRL